MGRQDPDSCAIPRVLERISCPNGRGSVVAKQFSKVVAIIYTPTRATLGISFLSFLIFLINVALWVGLALSGIVFASPE